jgi:hypothetical protein
LEAVAGEKVMSEFTPEEVEAFKRRLAQEQQSSAATAMTHSVSQAPSEKTQPHAMHYDPKTGFRPITGMERFRYGFGLGARNIAANVGEMLGMVEPDRVREMQLEGAPITQGSLPGKAGAFVGETSALLPVGMGVAGATGRLGMASRGALSGMTEGAVQGAVASGPDNRMAGALVGGAVGGALPSAQAIASALARGRDMTRSARNLTGRGVELTPGQMQPDSTWAMVEETMMGVPGLGPRIKAARERGWTQTQALIAQEAAPPGVRVQPRQDPQAMYRDLLDAYDQAYEVGRGFPVSPRIMRTQGKDVALSDALKVPAGSPGDDASRKYANSFLANEWSAIRGRQLQSDDLFALRSRIRAEARALRKNQNAPFKAADMLENAEKRVTEALESQLPTDVMRQVKDIDGKYGNLKVFEGALFRAGDRPEGFTPSQFSQEVRNATPSRMGYAAGGGRMRNISGAAKDVFDNRQPMTGRQLASLLPIAGASGAAVLGGGLPGAAAVGATTLGASLPYLRNAAGEISRDVIMGRTAPQVAYRNFERKMRRAFTPQEREAVARLLQTQGVVLATDQE